jgi:RimJ/RimL family protein N-acetyltransferase
MLRGELTGLRARLRGDAEILHAELYEDVETRVRGDSRPWIPVPYGPASPFWVGPGAEPARPDDPAFFSVVELAADELAGEALLWGIDLHNRSAHVGISLRPAFRGRGLGTDAVRVLCRYGFAIRGLHRLQLETLADNDAMLRAAHRAGFTREGVARGSDWVNGRFADSVIFGLLESDWPRLPAPRQDGRRSWPGWPAARPRARRGGMIIHSGGCLSTWCGRTSGASACEHMHR